MQKLKYVVGSDQRPLVPDIQNFTIDFNDAGIKNWVQARQYESSMRQVFLDIVNEDGTPFDLTGCNIWFEGLTPDNHRVIFDRQYVPIDPTAGQARIDFLAPAFAMAGSYKQAFFRIYKDGNNISTLEFKFSVLADKVISGIVSADYIQPFEALHAKLEDILANADGDLKSKLATWTNQFTDLMTKLSKQGTDTSNMLANVQTTLKNLETQIASDGLLKQADLDNFEKKSSKLLSDMEDNIDTLIADNADVRASVEKAIKANKIDSSSFIKNTGNQTINGTLDTKGLTINGQNIRGAIQGIVADSNVEIGVVKGTVGENKFDSENVQTDSYIDEKGDVEKAAGWYASSFIPIVSNGTYYHNLYTPVAFYDGEKKFIAMINKGKQFTVPDGAAFVRFAVNPEEGIDVTKVMLAQEPEAVPWEHYYVEATSDIIPNGSLDAIKMKYTPMTASVGKNMFDPQSAIPNCYIDFQTGILQKVEGFYASDFIRIQPDKQYVKNDTQQLAFYDSERNFVSGLNNEMSFTAPHTARYVRLTLKKELLWTLQLEIGTDATEYERYGLLNDVSTSIFSKTEVTVGGSGCNFSTIGAALDSIPVANAERITILLMPGTYVETVRGYGKKFSLVGLQRDSTIIKTFSNDYYNPPIDAAPLNYFENLTIIADDDGATTPKLGVNKLPAYAVHADVSGRGLDFSKSEYQGKTIFRNCRLISKYQHAAGIGLTPGQTLIWEDCEFESYNHPAFRAHNYMPAGGSPAQRMLVKNSTMHTIGTGGVIALQDPSHLSGSKDSNDVEFTFQNIIVYNDDGTEMKLFDTPVGDGTVAGTVKLGAGSFGNNIPELNK